MCYVKSKSHLGPGSVPYCDKSKYSNVKKKKVCWRKYSINAGRKALLKKTLRSLRSNISDLKPFFTWENSWDAIFQPCFKDISKHYFFLWQLQPLRMWWTFRRIFMIDFDEVYAWQLVRLVQRTRLLPVNFLTVGTRHKNSFSVSENVSRVLRRHAQTSSAILYFVYLSPDAI